MQTLLRRVATAGCYVVALYTLCFVLVEALPGDAAESISDLRLPAEQVERTRRVLGLDGPPLERWWTGLRSYLSGELGDSFRFRRPVIDVIAEAILPTLALGFAAVLFAYTFGPLLAVALAPRDRKSVCRERV